MRRLLFVVACCICVVITLSVGELNAKPRGFKNDNGTKPKNETGKVCLCHIPPGKPSGAHTICVGASAVDAHLAHGDTLGFCPTVCGCDGMAYDNDCFAAGAAVNVEHAGECDGGGA